jgi:hypothetical protein
MGCGNVWALSFHRKSVPLYFVVATNQHAALLLDRSRQFIKTLWGQQDHFRLHIPGTDATTDNVHDVKPPTMRRDGILASSQIVNRPESKRIGERTTDIGFNNRNRQKVIRRTSFLGADHCQYVYALLCSDCGHNYGANGSDIFQRKCPRCQSGKPGLRYEERTENDASEKRTR